MSIYKQWKFGNQNLNALPFTIELKYEILKYKSYTICIRSPYLKLQNIEKRNFHKDLSNRKAYHVYGLEILTQ